MGCDVFWKRQCVCVEKGEVKIVLDADGCELVRARGGEWSIFDDGIVFYDNWRFLDFWTGRDFAVKRRDYVEAFTRLWRDDRHIRVFVFVDADIDVEDITGHRLEMMADVAESGALACFFPRGVNDGTRAFARRRLGFSLRPRVATDSDDGGRTLVFAAFDHDHIAEFKWDGGRVKAIRIYSFSNDEFVVVFEARSGQIVKVKVGFVNGATTIAFDQNYGYFDCAVSASDLPHSLVFMEDSARVSFTVPSALP
jgi:hypothetical protein